jgi:hypothetical protein
VKRVFVIMMGALIILLGALVQSAEAQEACGLRQELASKLEKSYQETPTGIGLAKNGGVFEVFTSPTGTWTILFTRPDGHSCLMAVGDHWESKAPELAGLNS